MELATWTAKHDPILLNHILGTRLAITLSTRQSWLNEHHIALYINTSAVGFKPEDICTGWIFKHWDLLLKDLLKWGGRKNNIVLADYSSKNASRKEAQDGEEKNGLTFLGQ